MKSLQKVDRVTAALVALGAISWGVVGLARRPTAGKSHTGPRTVLQGIYGIVGVSALYRRARQGFESYKTQAQHTARS